VLEANPLPNPSDHRFTDGTTVMGIAIYVLGGARLTRPDLDSLAEVKSACSRIAGHRQKVRRT